MPPLLRSRAACYAIAERMIGTYGESADHIEPDGQHVAQMLAHVGRVRGMWQVDSTRCLEQPVRHARREKYRLRAQLGPVEETKT